MPLEPETDITLSAIKWLVDDPTASPDHRATIVEVLKALGAEDPDDPLVIALVQDGMRKVRADAEAPPPPTASGWVPEFCGEDANRKRCNEPVSATGRCMSCGAQRIEPAPPDPAIKAAQMASEPPEPEAPRCLLCKRLLNQADDPLSVDCGGDCLGCIQEIETGMKGGAEEELTPLAVAPPVKSPTFTAIDKAKLKEQRKPLPAKIHIGAPSRDVRERLLDTMREACTHPDLTMTQRIKRISGMSDAEIGGFMNRSRATIQAYAQDARREIYDTEQTQILIDVLVLRRNMLDDLLLELEAAKCPSES